jgi:hypothetical protein
MASFARMVRCRRSDIIGPLRPAAFRLREAPVDPVRIIG